MAGTATMNRDELKKLFSEYAGPIVAEAVDQAVAKRLEGLGKPATTTIGDMLQGTNGTADKGMPPAVPAPTLPDIPAELGLLEPLLRRAGWAKQTQRPNVVGPYVRCLVLARGNLDRAVANAKKLYPSLYVGGGDEPAITLSQWFETKALAAGDAGGGGFIVPPQFSQDVVELLYPQSVVRAAGPMVIPMTTGTVRIPKITAGSSATYIGENTNIVASQQVFGQLVLTFKKLAALVPLSNDLIRYASPAADSIVRNDIVRQIAAAENAVFLRGDGTASTPKGLRNWMLAANTIATNGTWLAASPTDIINVVTDLGNLIKALVNANVPITSGAWFMAPSSWWKIYSITSSVGTFVFRDEMARGTLLGYPYYRSTQIPHNLGAGTTTELMFVDMADVVLGEAQNLIVDASTEAAYVDTTGATISAYSQDQTVIRAIAEHDLAVRRQESLACTTGVIDQ